MANILAHPAFNRRNIVVFSAGLIFLSTLVFFWTPNTRTTKIARPSNLPSFPPPLPISGATPHPVDELVRLADEKFNSIVREESHSLEDAVRTYRERRGRHPPPGFDKWYQFSIDKKAPVIESFFDEIYENLEPFWGISPASIRDFPKSWPNVISVRNGVIYPRTTLKSLWMLTWVGMMREMPELPDIDISVNPGDEPRVLVPFSKIEKHMKEANNSKGKQKNTPLEKMSNNFPRYTQMDYDIATLEPEGHRTAYAQEEFWNLVKTACRPDDPINQSPSLVPNSSVPPVFSTEYTIGSLKGYVSNYTTARNVCHNPNLRTLHGFLIHPFAKTMYTDLVPVFAVAKLVGITNDILIPPPTHYPRQGLYAGPEHTISWKSKKDAAVWRGTATGGNHTEKDWYGFHRHRFVQVMNGTSQSIIEHELEESGIENATVQALEALSSDKFELGLHNIPFPLRHLFGIAAQSYRKLGSWLHDKNDGGFINMHCSQQEYIKSWQGGPKTCKHTDLYYSVADFLNMTQIMSYKYLPDVDGHTASGRFLGFLRSLSLPIKSTIFSEWHDARLIPWRHFVPMSAEYQEWWGLMQYFLGYKGEEGEISIPGHDEVAERIAHQGYEWVEKVETPESLLIYFYRVILEFARITADNRIELGFVEDLRSAASG